MLKKQLHNLCNIVGTSHPLLTWCPGCVTDNKASITGTLAVGATHGHTRELGIFEKDQTVSGWLMETK